MEGRARAPGAVSVVNAIMGGRGAAMAIDRHVEARVSLDPDVDGVSGLAADRPDVDASLVERCVEVTTARYGDGEGGAVETRSALPPSVGLKTSSAAANAAVLATLDALEVTEVDPLQAARLGVLAARAVGVTATGALDDAAASMLGGVAVTDNDSDALLARGSWDRDLVVLVPPGRTPTATVDVAALERFAPLGAVATESALAGDYARAMACNAVGVTAALALDIEPVLEGLRTTGAASPSGTGPAVAAVGASSACDRLAAAWADRGRVIRTRSDRRGARPRGGPSPASESPRG
ncbi:MAG: shikimate kinase [Halobacteriales archaeon]